MIYVITGPPCSGKSTWIKERAKPGDLRFDFDHIASIIEGSEPGHTHSHPARRVTQRMHKAFLEAVLKDPPPGIDVYIIHSKPRPQAMQRLKAHHGVTVVELDPGEQVVLARCRAERDSETLEFAKSFYRKPTRQRHTSELGLGYSHKQNRRRLLYNHKDGSPCWWCGRPMYRDPERNHDKLPLAADHSKSRATHGYDNRNLADRLLHGSCNSQRGDGTRDYTRPALNTKRSSNDRGPQTGVGFAW